MERIELNIKTNNDEVDYNHLVSEIKNKVENVYDAPALACEIADAINERLSDGESINEVQVGRTIYGLTIVG